MVTGIFVLISKVFNFIFRICKLFMVREVTVVPDKVYFLELAAVKFDATVIQQLRHDILPAVVCSPVVDIVLVVYIFIGVIVNYELIQLKFTRYLD